jgi:hypothetical protein
MRVFSILSLRLSLLAAAAMILSGCGGGSDAPPVVVDPPPVAQVGSVALFFTDGPTDDFDRVEITVTSIEFLSDDGPESIWEGEETFDLLALEHYTDYFAFAEGIPAGSYDKVRLRVSGVTLVRVDGAEEEQIEVKLPANGKIDLNPRGSFEVPLGGVLLLEIDIDAKRSIQVVETGNGGFRFRPVVFVDAIGSVEPGKLVRVHGVVQALDRGEGEFVLCPTEFVADANGEDGDFAEGGCIEIETAGGASFFMGADGMEVSLDQLNDGDETTVIGFFSPGDDGDSEESDSLFVLAAEVVEIGPVGAFARLPGTVTGPLDAGNDFPFEVAEGNGFDPGYVATVETQPGTKVFSGESEPLTILDVSQFDELLIDAVAVEGDILRSALIIIETQGPDELEYSGTVASLGPGGREFQFTTADVEGGTACVVVPEGTPIQEGEEGGELTDVDFDAIQADREGTVFGFFFEGEPCISASYIRLEPEAGGGT